MNGAAQWLGAVLLPIALLPAPLAGEDTARPRILGVAHIAIYAHDYERSRAFYRDFLGLEEPYSLAKPDRNAYTRAIELKVGVNRKRQANLFDPDGTRTELMAPATIDGTPTPPSTAPLPR